MSDLHLMKNMIIRTTKNRKAKPRTLAITMAISQLTPKKFRKFSITQRLFTETKNRNNIGLI